MADDTTTPAVGVILEQLRAAVRERHLIDGREERSAVEQDVQRSLDEIELHRVISAHWPLQARHPLERVVHLFHKIVRRLLRWYINPIVEQQNAYNDAVARTLRVFADAYRELAEQSGSSSAPPSDPMRQSAADQPALPADASLLQQLVDQRGPHEPEARFVELELVACAQQLQLRQHVQAHWPLAGTTLQSKTVALSQAALRRYLRWLINPIVEQQNNANIAIGSALHNLIRLDADRRADVARMRATRHTK